MEEYKYQNGNGSTQFYKHDSTIAIVGDSLEARIAESINRAIHVRESMLKIKGSKTNLELPTEPPKAVRDSGGVNAGKSRPRRHQ